MLSFRLKCTEYVLPCHAKVSVCNYSNSVVDWKILLHQWRFRENEIVPLEYQVLDITFPDPGDF